MISALAMASTSDTSSISFSPSASTSIASSEPSVSDPESVSSSDGGASPASLYRPSLSVRQFDFATPTFFVLTIEVDEVVHHCVAANNHLSIMFEYSGANISLLLLINQIREGRHNMHVSVQNDFQFRNRRVHFFSVGIAK